MNSNAHSHRIDSLSNLPLVEAHRGDTGNAPENTLSAFERALDIGVPWIELDVHPAKDGTLMVIHDETVDRTTNGTGRVSDMSVDELSGLDAGIKFSTDFTGERIPRLCEVMERVAGTGTRLNVEIKAAPTQKHVPRNLVELLRQFGKQREYIVSSFDLQTLLDVRSLDSQISLALIGSMPWILNQAERHHFPWVHGKQQTVTREAVIRAHAHGIRVNVWTVNDAEQWSFWRRLGVDKICTNWPALMTRLCFGG